MNHSTWSRCLGLAVVYVASFTSRGLQAEVRLPAIFGDNMVLQRQQEIPVWGTAAAEEKVTVELGEQSAETVAGSDGRWMVRLPMVEEAGPARLVVRGSNELEFKNVLLGEVWVCSGQSNMAMSVARCRNAEQEIAQANFPEIRLFQVKQHVSGEPVDDVEGEWKICSPETIPNFSAAAYYFGRHTHQALDVPVGLIQSAVGGTPAEAWMSDAALAEKSEFKPILDRWSEILAHPEKYQQQYEVQLARWKERAAAARQAGKPVPRRPRPPLGPEHRHRASGLYNGMIAPLVPFAIRGVIWYQGEANAGRAYQYRELFPALIQDWRKQWDQGDFPFLFVQLANYMQVADAPGESAWAELREAQTMALELPSTGMAVTIDIGEADDIHPKNKQDVGRRLGLAAEQIAYGRNLVASGPMLQSMTIEQNRIRIRFDNVGSGLLVKGGELRGFAIAGQDRKFVNAQASLDGDTVIVHSDQVPRPIAVRYAWANNPVCNLYNQESLPANPFRTDIWPGVTVGKQ